MKTIVTFLLAILSFAGFAQIKNFRIGIEANYSIIPSKESQSNSPMVFPYAGYLSYYTNTPSFKESYSANPGINLKGSFDMTLSNRFYFRSGLTFSYINYQRKITVTRLSNDIILPDDRNYQVIAGNPYSSFYGFIVDGVLENGNPRYEDLEPFVIENSNAIGKTTLINVQLPLLIGTSFFKERLAIHAGGVASAALHASSHKLDLVQIEKETTTNEFTPISFGAMVGLSFKIVNKVAVEISGQHSFSSLYKQEYQQSGKARMNLVSAGISYQLK